MNSITGHQDGRGSIGSLIARACILALVCVLCAAGARAELRFDLPQQEIGSLPDGARGMVAADLDQDGDLDLVTGGGDWWAPGTTHQTIAWENDGTPFPGSWLAHPIRNTDFWVRGLAVGDLDGDGRPDLVLGENRGSDATDSRVVVLSNDGTPFDGLWSSYVVAAYSGGPYCGHVAASDLDGDGWLDLACAIDASGLWIWQNDGTPFAGAWSGTAVLDWPTRSARGSLSIGDLDRDGDPDMAFSPDEAQLAVMGNDGTPFDGGWTYLHVGWPAYGGVYDITIADWDGDLYPDLASTIMYQPSAPQFLWRNDGTPFDGGWTQSTFGDSPIGCSAAGDLDFDGDQDLVTGSSWQEDFEVIAWENDGTPFDEYLPQRDLCAVGDDVVVNDVVADLDGDGDLDLAFVSSIPTPTAMSRVSVVRNLAADPRIVSVADVPQDQGGKVVVRWDACRLDGDPSWGIESYWLWRRLSETAAQALLQKGVQVLAAGEGWTRSEGRPALRRTLEGAASVYWEFIAEIPARGVGGYAYTVTTHSDGVAETFVVDAKSASGPTLYASLPGSGSSVDNLAPAPPAPFTGAYVAGTTWLHWGPSLEADFKEYAISRGATSTGTFTPMAAQADTGFGDPGPAGSYYRLTAIDVHGNESDFALLGPDGTVSVGGEALSFALGGVRPNPTGGERLSVEFVLAQEGPAYLELLDVAGRRVLTRDVGSLGIGRHRVELSAGARLASGVYLMRLAQGREVRVQRVAIVE